MTPTEQYEIALHEIIARALQMVANAYLRYVRERKKALEENPQERLPAE